MVKTDFFSKNNDFKKNNRYLHMKADLSQLHKLVKDL
mgnify:FL=1